MSGGLRIEFKKTLPDRQGGVAPWLSGKNEIGDYARDEVLSELVAFANSGGGFVIVGIDETDEKPPRAKSIEPLPRVADLASRVEDQIRSCIDLPLFRFGVKAIETDGSGRGVLIIQTGASHRAPHRLTTTRHSYVRRGSSSMKMTMREIQDMTLNVARGTAGIEAVFDERKGKFHEWGVPFPKWAAFRITAVPLEIMPDPGRMLGRQEFLLPVKRYSIVMGGIRKELHLAYASSDRPILRGIARYDDSSTRELRIEQYQNGLIDLWSRYAPDTPGRSEPGPLLYQGWLLAGVANVLSLLDNHRKIVGSPNAEYAVETEVTRFPITGLPDHPPLCIGLAHQFGFEDRYLVHEFPVVLPRITVGDRHEFRPGHEYDRH